MKSPSGSEFPYYYKNGILHAIKLSSIVNNKNEFNRIIDAEIEFTKKQNETSVFWIDLYGIKLTKSNKEYLLKLISELGNKMKKCALVGLNGINTIRIKWSLTRSKNINMKIRYFDDPEIAKTWLIKSIKENII